MVHVQSSPAAPRDSLGDDLASAIDGVRVVVLVVDRQAAGAADELRRGDDHAADRRRGGNGIHHVLRSLGVLPVVVQGGGLVTIGAGGEVDDVGRGKRRQCVGQGLAVQNVAGPPLVAMLGAQRRRHVHVQVGNPAAPQVLDEIRADEAGAAGDEDAGRRGIGDWGLGIGGGRD